MIPKDPMMLLSYVNTQLRDNYSDLESFCQDQETDMDSLQAKLKAVGYEYDKSQNRFM